MDDQQIEFLNDQGKELNDERGLHLSVSEQIILCESVVSFHSFFLKSKWQLINCTDFRVVFCINCMYFIELHMHVTSMHFMFYLIIYACHRYAFYMNYICMLPYLCFELYIFIHIAVFTSSMLTVSLNSVRIAFIQHIFRNLFMYLRIGN